MRKVHAAAMTFVVAIIASPAFSQESEKVSPSPVTATPNPVLATPALPLANAVYPQPKEQILIKATIFETNPNLRIAFEKDVEIIQSPEQGGAIQILSKQSIEDFRQKLGKAAKVLSNPKMITLDGQSAQIQVGQEVVLERPGTSPATKTVGLKLECRPVITKDRLRIELKCENSRLNKDEQRIEVQNLQTAAEMDWGETVAVAGIGKDLLLLVSPQRIQTQPQPTHVYAPVQVTSARLQPTPKQAGAFNRITAIYNIFGGSAIAKVEQIEMGQDSLKILATMDPKQQKEIPAILERFGLLSPYKVTSVTQSMGDDTIRMEVECRKPSESKNQNDEPLENLDSTLQSLFPSERIKLTALPAAIVVGGVVERDVIDEIVVIAQQYYPNVINQLKAKSIPAAVKQPGPSLSEQLDGLRSEIRLLRTEVGRLIDTMKKEQDSEASFHPTVSKITPDKPWKVTVDELLDIAKQNHPKMKNDEWLRRKSDIFQAYSQLATLPTASVTPTHSHSALDELKAGEYQEARVAYQPIGYRLSLTRNRAAEIKLRRLVGLPSSDGRRLEPTDKTEPR